MQIPEYKTNDTELTGFIEVLKAVFRKFSSDNFEIISIQGTTDPILDTKKQFKHNGRRAPQFYFKVEGDVYIASKGMGTFNVDIRSRLTNEDFKILLVF